MQQASKNIKLRSNSVNSLQHSLQYERKNRLQTMIEQDKSQPKNHNYLSMLSILNQSISIKKQFLSLSCTLTIVYEIQSNSHLSNPKLQTISQQMISAQKTQKLTLHIKKVNMIIIKNQTKHIHSISPQICSKDLLINLQIPNKIISVHIETQQPSKKVDIDLNKLSLNTQKQLENYSAINPLQFIEQGIKLRASKMQSTGKTKKLVWGNDSASKTNSANIRNSLPNLIQEPSDIPFQPNRQLTPFNDNFQKICAKKLQFSKHTNNQKEGMFGQLQNQMDKKLFKEIGKKLVTQAKQSLVYKLSKVNKTHNMLLNKKKSQPDCTLKDRNRDFGPQNQTKQQQKQVQSQQKSKKFHSRQYSDHSQQNLENFFNMDTQKGKEKKKVISYKTDITSLCPMTNSVQVVESGKKTTKNKQNDSINQKALMLKKGIISSKKMMPNSSFVGTAMVKSIRIKTQAN